MIFEHEIPQGSKLYFGESAKYKRSIEAKANEILQQKGFEEIVTPFFTYHTHLASKHPAEETRRVVRLGDDENNLVALRPDSSMDVVRIITKRLGRSTDHKRWFYIQPVFAYPTTEVHQIGVEHIECKSAAELPKLAIEIFASIEVAPILQLSSAKIPQLAAQHLHRPIEDVTQSSAARLAELNIDWLDALLAFDSVSHMDTLPKSMPQSIVKELQTLCATALDIRYEKIVLAPLYLSGMSYYTDFFFRFLDGNDVVARGGNYISNETHSSGFAIYTDIIVQRHQQ